MQSRSEIWSYWDPKNIKKGSVVEINSRLERAEEKTNELENAVIETFQAKAQRRKK